MHIPLSKIIRFSVVVASVGVFVVVADLLFNAFVGAQNRKQLQDLNRRTLERAERAVDYALISLAELAEHGATSCDEASLRQIRRQVYLRGSIKDIRVADRSGNVLCSAFPETLSYDTGSVADASKLAGRNGRVFFFRLDQESSSALGLLWQAGENLSLIAVVNNEALLFDILPQALRANSRVVLELGNAAEIASYSVRDDTALWLPSPVNFTTWSERYPLQMSVQVGGPTFQRWNRESELAFHFLAGALGLAFGILLGKTVGRPKDPISELDQGLANGEFVPYLQPIFSLSDRRIVGCEALARWQHADGSVDLPYHFVPLAESSGRIVPLTWQVVSKTLTFLSPVLRADKNFKVAFNIAPDHFLSSSFVEDFCRQVRQARVGTRQIMVELTERQQLHNLANAAEVIARLRDRGFKVAIDDTGTGHSGLSYIHKLGVDVIKIDKLFVDSVVSDHTAQAVIEMLVKLARELKMTTLAEGIETEEQISLLKDYGVHEGQGFVVSGPVPLSDFFHLLAGRAQAPIDPTVSVPKASVA